MSFPAYFNVGQDVSTLELCMSMEIYHTFHFHNIAFAGASKKFGGTLKLRFTHNFQERHTRVRRSPCVRRVPSAPRPHSYFPPKLGKTRCPWSIYIKIKLNGILGKIREKFQFRTMQIPAIPSPKAREITRIWTTRAKLFPHCLIYTDQCVAVSFLNFPEEGASAVSTDDDKALNLEFDRSSEE